MNKTLGLSIGIFLLFFASNALAIPYAEIPDAGQTLGTAQTLPGGVDVVTGSVSGDADLFGFYWDGGGFYANTIGSSFDSQLFLFDSSGNGLWGNDEGVSIGGPAGPAYIHDSALSAGLYFIGVSAYDYEPLDSSDGLIFQSIPWQKLYPAYSDAGPLDHWAGDSFSSGSYQINFQQIDIDGIPVGYSTPTGNPVPEPATILLLGCGFFGLAGLKRGLGRKKKKQEIPPAVERPA